MTFKIGDSIIDSRDIIDRFNELQNEYDSIREDDPSGCKLALWSQGKDGKEYYLLQEFIKEAAFTTDWEYGTALIHESYFEEHMDETIADYYELPKNLPFWMEITYDYEVLKQDYKAVELANHIYFVR